MQAVFFARRTFSADAKQPAKTKSILRSLLGRPRSTVVQAARTALFLPVRTSGRTKPRQASHYFAGKDSYILGLGRAELRRVQSETEALLTNFAHHLPQ